MLRAALEPILAGTTTAAAILLAVILAWAAKAKLRAPAQVGDDFASMGLRRPKTLAKLVPLAELVTAGLLVVRPQWGGIVAVMLLVGFTTMIVRVLRKPDEFGSPTCACFGGSAQQTLSWKHVVRNVGLLLLALVPVL